MLKKLPRSKGCFWFTLISNFCQNMYVPFQHYRFAVFLRFISLRNMFLFMLKGILWILQYSFQECALFDTDLKKNTTGCYGNLNGTACAYTCIEPNNRFSPQERCACASMCHREKRGQSSGDFKCPVDPCDEAYILNYNRIEVY